MTDEELFAELTEVVASTDPLPPPVLAAAAEAGAVTAPRGIRLHEVDPAPGMRGDDLIMLRAYGVTVRVELGEAVTGVVTGTGGVVELRTPAGSWFAEIDPAGRFSVEGLPRGPVSLRVHGDALLVGEWMTW
ncbi:hypothetical protein [Crossiella sp. CA198]|uniref:hypothetical protein n=1 Tax=Crossiella sp. CA198 TaxID=3455607 RepID=UPI003F8D4028